MPTRRMKTYTSQSGYVYQYYFVGKRDAVAGEPEGPAVEFVFDVTPDRKTMYAVSVFLKPEALATWSARYSRPLSEPEQYAAAKMRLLAGFDEMGKLQEHVRLRVDAANIEDLLGGIGLE
jgi:hypothetical protein